MTPAAPAPTSVATTRAFATTPASRPTFTADPLPSEDQRAGSGDVALALRAPSGVGSGLGQKEPRNSRGPGLPPGGSSATCPRQSWTRLWVRLLTGFGSSIASPPPSYVNKNEGGFILFLCYFPSIPSRSAHGDLDFPPNVLEKGAQVELFSTGEVVCCL